MKKSARGFTLIELLIVVAIMAMVSIFTLSNYKSFGEDQNLKSAVLDIQSLLRQAQTSAVANAICSGSYTALWQVEFAGTLGASPVITLKCSTATSSSQKPPLQIAPNIVIDSISGTGSDCPTALPFTVNLSLLKGNIDFDGLPNCASLTITLKNTKTQSTKSLIIEQGGRVYGE